MRRLALWFALSLFVGLSLAAPCWAATPRIVSVNITRLERTWPGNSSLTHCWGDDVTVVVEDTDGVADLANLQITAPGGSVASGPPEGTPFRATPSAARKCRRSGLLPPGVGPNFPRARLA